MRFVAFVVITQSSVVWLVCLGKNQLPIILIQKERP